jgi:hypothetical protein
LGILSRRGDVGFDADVEAGVDVDVNVDIDSVHRIQR